LNRTNEVFTILVHRMKMTDKTWRCCDTQVQVFDRNSTFPGSARMIGVIDLSLRKVLSEQNRR
jgi:hypothetical protein